MTKINSVLLLLLAVSCLIPGIIMETSPGYMDADYYYSGGINLTSGNGFTQNFIWNYLDNPSSLPQPAHTYWMPFASIVAAAGLSLNREYGFVSARLLFLLLAAVIPIVTTSFCFKISARRDIAYLAGIMACLSGFYYPYLITTDTFGLYMLLGTYWLILSSDLAKSEKLQHRRIILENFLTGVISGLLHLTRADGIFWFGFAILIGIYQIWGKSRIGFSIQFLFFCLLTIMIGYLLVMSPWYFRNYSVFGELFPPGNRLTLMMTGYNDIFIYPPAKLNFANWFSSGAENIIKARIFAIRDNLISALVVQTGIILFPLVILGLRKTWGSIINYLGVLTWFFIFGLLSIIFPFASTRGGYFHAGAAFQPLIWSLAAVGFFDFISIGVKYRGWNSRLALVVFKIGLLLILVVISGYVINKRIIGKDIYNPVWNSPKASYQRLETLLTNIHQEQSLVMLNNPPGFFAITGNPSIIVPVARYSDLLVCGQKYNIDFLILDKNFPPDLGELYENPRNYPGLELRLINSGFVIYQFDDN